MTLTTRTQIIAAMLRAGRTDLANVVAHLVTAALRLVEQGDEYVVQSPSYMAIKDAIPDLKKAGFKYNGTDKSWRLPKSKLTPARRKRVEKWVVIDKQDDKQADKKPSEVLDESEVAKMVPQLSFFTARPYPKALLVFGPTYDVQDKLKRAGGRWAASQKGYLFSYDTMSREDFDGLFKSLVKFDKDLEKQRDKALKNLKPLVDGKWETFTARVERGRFTMRTGDRAYRDIVKSYFPKAKWTSPFWTAYVDDAALVNIPAMVKEITELDEKLVKDRMVQKPVKAPKVTKVPGAPYSFERGEGYGGDDLPSGTVLNTSKLRQPGWPEYVTVVETKKYYVKEDGLSFGVGDESGYIFTYYCRESTPEEVAEKRAREQKLDNKAAAKKRVYQIVKHMRDKGRRPEPWVQPKGDRYEFVPMNLYGGGEWFVIDKDTIWYVQNNGADGDNWAWNNVRTGGAGAIGWTLRDADLAREIEQHMKTLGVKS